MRSVRDPFSLTDNDGRGDAEDALIDDKGRGMTQPLSLPSLD